VVPIGLRSWSAGAISSVIIEINHADSPAHYTVIIATIILVSAIVWGFLAAAAPSASASA
jgi:small neutral amino acid transporter SnatA (MarC family)